MILNSLFIVLDLLLEFFFRAVHRSHDIVAFRRGNEIVLVFCITENFHGLFETAEVDHNFQEREPLKEMKQAFRFLHNLGLKDIAQLAVACRYLNFHD